MTLPRLIPAELRIIKFEPSIDFTVFANLEEEDEGGGGGEDGADLGRFAGGGEAVDDVADDEGDGADAVGVVAASISASQIHCKLTFDDTFDDTFDLHAGGEKAEASSLELELVGVVGLELAEHTIEIATCFKS